MCDVRSSCILFRLIQLQEMGGTAIPPGRVISHLSSAHGARTLTVKPSDDTLLTENMLTP